MKELLKDERKRPLLILMIVIIILSLTIGIILLITKKEEKKEEVITTTTTKKVDEFKGYKKYTIDYNKDITYNYKDNYEFIYANKDDKSIIYTIKKQLELYYELSLVNGKIEFKEQRHNKELNAYEYTGKKYYSTNSVSITDYIVASTCESDSYSIIAIDTNKSVYIFKTPEEEYDINYIINNFNKVSTITKAKKVGYYNYSNEAGIECNDYELVYLDQEDKVRTLEDKNPIFFDSAYYKYLGLKDNANFVYVLKDGKMLLDNNNKNINDGNYPIYYRGSFYKIVNNEQVLYIISKEGYLFKVDSNNKSTNIPRVNNNKIKQIGTRTISDSNGFATSNSNIIIEFENDEEKLKLEEITDFELLN